MNMIGIDKIAIDVGGKDVILSITAEEKLRKLLNKREKSSLLYKQAAKACQNIMHQEIKYSVCKFRFCLHVTRQKIFHA